MNKDSNELIKEACDRSYSAECELEKLRQTLSKLKDAIGQDPIEKKQDLNCTVCFATEENLLILTEDLNIKVEHLPNYNVHKQFYINNHKLS